MNRLKPYLLEDTNDEIMVCIRIESEIRSQELLELVAPPNALFPDHLDHGISEVLLWVEGSLHHCKTVGDGGTLYRFLVCFLLQLSSSFLPVLLWFFATGSPAVQELHSPSSQLCLAVL